MLESFPVMLLVGTVLGFLAGLGVGGGSLLILWLTLVIGMPAGEARLLNLLFFLPSAIISSLFRWRQGAVDFKKISPAIIFGCISAGFFAFWGSRLNSELLKKLFGILLLATGIRELLYKPK